MTQGSPELHFEHLTFFTLSDRSTELRERFANAVAEQRISPERREELVWEASEKWRVSPRQLDPNW